MLAFDQPRRLRFRFSLRALLIAMLCCVVFLGAWVRRARQQREGVAWVRSQGGHITYDYEWPEADGSYPVGAKPPGPKWLRDRLGIEYFAVVTGVILDRDEITDLSALSNLPHLRCIGLMNYVHPQTDFAPLQSLKRLEELHLNYTGLEMTQVQAI